MKYFFKCPELHLHLRDTRQEFPIGIICCEHSIPWWNCNGICIQIMLAFRSVYALCIAGSPCGLPLLGSCQPPRKLARHHEIQAEF